MTMKTKRYSSASDVVEYRPKPTLNIDTRDVPCVKDMKVGETYTFTVKARVLAVNAPDELGTDDGPDNYKNPRARLRITSIKDK